MKKKLMSNLFLKIISAVAAFLFWLVIINVTDPTTERTFYSIPVRVINENVITSANQVYEIVDGDKIDVSVKGKRSFVEKLKEDDFTATADMSGLSKVNAVSIRVELNTPVAKSEYELDWNNAMLKVELEDRVSQKFKVEVSHEGELSQNYVLGEMSATPNIVEVSCGKSKFKKIDHVGVVVQLNGERDGFEADYKPLLYDKNGEIIDDTNVTFSNDTIRVSTQVLATKEVEIRVEATGKPARNYRLVQTDYKPESIQICGSKEALESAPSHIDITVPIDGAKYDVEKDVPLYKYLKGKVDVVDNITSIAVRCQIERNGLRRFTVNLADIGVRNLPDNCEMTFAADSDKYEVILRGEETALENVSQLGLGAYVDLYGYGVGTHMMYLLFDLPEGVLVENTIRVKVVLKSKEGEGEGEEPAPATEPVKPTELEPSPADTARETDSVAGTPEQ